MQCVKEYVKPPNQLCLSDAELAEELACSLTTSNPAAPSNVVRFIPKDNTYKVVIWSSYIPPHSAIACLCVSDLEASADSKSPSPSDRVIAAQH
jgi:hypothetical protein